MLTVRTAKLAVTLMIACSALLATYNNITDYLSNFAYSQSFLSMDTVYNTDHVLYRTLTWPTFWHASYWLIIAGKGLTGILLLCGARSMWAARGASAAQFDAAKKWMITGATLGFVIWIIGFLVIGTERFLLWQSEHWNGQATSFMFSGIILGALIFVNQPEQELR
ncbi:hypothetical protein PRtIB026_A45840 [Pseudomonas sp. RtIB026]|uniref:DUF2165 family protein n=1 Tax=Pseudomonas sp. RtIB026 TaxID=2749999 RepID=UPI001944F38C|nr:DUF2165 domain-containing protein [Pseudomonas sp. RtIB026]BCJ05617.1 hypothetical protein PRtIB026_A45840 [Pseudomonas sp. RtIB026]